MLKIVAESETVLGLLLKEATDFLRSFDTSTPESIEEMIRRREDILERFHDLNARIALQSEHLNADELESFRQRKDAAVRKIVEIDALVIALARKQLSSIKEDLSALSKGKKVLHAYERGSVTSSHKLNDTV